MSPHSILSLRDHAHYSQSARRHNRWVDKATNHLLHCALAIMLVAMSALAFGQSIFTNPITGTNPNTSNPYTTGQTVNGNITVTGIGRGSGISGNVANDRYNATAWSLAAGGFDANDYFYWTITPNSGYKINFTSFVYTGQASGTGPNTFAVRSSADGYVGNIGSPTVGGATIGLSASSYQNITSAITFRFYGWGGSNAGGTFSINDFTFNGTVVQLPAITASTTSLPAFNTQVGTPSAVQTFTVSGAALTTPLLVTAPTGFEVRENGVGSYGSSVSFTGPTVGTKTIQVRMTGAAPGAFSGNVACTSASATTRNVAVSGNVINVNTTIQFSATGATVSENAASNNLSVQITNPSGSAATNFQLALTTGDPAVVGNFTTQNLSFLAGSSTALSVPITITDNGIWNTGSTVVFTLQSVSGGQGTPGTGSNATYTLNINEYLGYSLVINEVDYAHPGEDAEFIEIKNTGSNGMDLQGFELDLVFDDGGLATPYDNFTLPNHVLLAGGRYVLCGNAANVAGCDMVVPTPVDFIVGGITAAIGLRDPSNALIDALSYEGNVAGYTEGSGASLIDPDTEASVSLARIPDGQDTQQNDVDWQQSCTTAGAANTAPGQSCDDGNGDTILDVVQANCTCAGVPIPEEDCLGVNGGPALPGTPCDDLDANTGNDTWNASCQCMGQAFDCQGVAGGSALPGTACNDLDTDTENDTWDANCNCAGTPIPYDCLNIAHGTALPGTACDDANATTGNDTWDANCQCVGQLIDCENVPGGAALPGTACNDGNVNTINDTWSASCQCVGTVVDCQGVPSGPAMPGTACNDNDPATWNDVWSAGCVCAGTPVPPGGAAMIEWNFNTASPSVNTAGDITVSNVTQGNNNGTTALITAVSVSSGYAGVSGGNNAGAAARTGALATGAGGSAYFEFTLQPFASRTVTLTSFSGGFRSTGTGPQAFTLRTSLDNYTSDVSTFPVTVANNSSWTLHSRPGLSVASGIGTPITFRIYGYNGTGSASASTANWRMDDLHLNVAVATPVVDCNGVAGGPALPGTPCNDGDACTTNDVWSMACACAGAFADNDGDGTCNANDGCQNDPDKIAPGVCGCGTADVPTTYYADADGDGFGDASNSQAGFTCDVPVGFVANNTDLCPADINKQAPGACGCGTADVPVTYYADVDGDGFGDASNSQAGFTCDVPVGFVTNDTDLCPADINKQVPGACGCGTADVTTTYYADVDGDGFGDASNSQAGFTCDVPVGFVTNDTDLCPADINKQVPGACGCGTADVTTTYYADVDGDGFGDASNSQAGFTCDVPVGFVANSTDDCPTLNGVIGSTCDDGDPLTGGDVINANCVCAGAATDCLGVPGGSAQPGTPCDDGNANTAQDSYNASCNCVGIACTTNLVFAVETDANGSETTWEIREQGTNTVVQSGGPYPSNAILENNTCLPDGCYYLRVLDAGGDGIVGGGYTLRTEAGKRIVDNRDNFSSGSVSAVAGDGAFCLPLGNDRLITVSCDRLDLRRGMNGSCSDRLTADNTPNSTSGNVYQFWFFDPNGSFSMVFPSATGATSNIVSMSQLPSLVEGRLYNVRVRTRISTGVWRPWGPACRMRIDNVAGQCPATQLQNEAGVQLSCGQTKTLGSTSANLIYAKPATRFNANCVDVSATKYQFRFRIPSEGLVIVKTGVNASPWTYLNMANVVGTPLPIGATLQPCRTYEVETRASFDGGATWCVGGSNPYTDLAPWGVVCQVNTSGCGSAVPGQGNGSIMDGTAGSMMLYPNPNRGDQLYIAMTGIEAGVGTVSVDIYDTFGKLVNTRTLAAQDGFINTTLELNGTLATGMYVVSITAGDIIHTERLVIQP